MNEKECYSVLSEFLDQIEKQYCLEKGSYRITFYPRQDVMVCFSIIAADKSRIRIENNILISYVHDRIPKVMFKFRHTDFLRIYFKNINDFYKLDTTDKVEITGEALNEIYLDQAKIPMQLL